MITKFHPFPGTGTSRHGDKSIPAENIRENTIFPIESVPAEGDVILQFFSASLRIFLTKMNKKSAMAQSVEVEARLGLLRAAGRRFIRVSSDRAVIVTNQKEMTQVI